MINHHVLESVKYYCRLGYSPQYAILIDGPWGVGKTSFYENELKPFLEKQSTQQFIYVSLNGLSTRSEIDIEIFQALHPVLGSPAVRGIAKVVLKAVTVKTGINLFGDSSKEDVEIKSPEINILRTSIKSANFILIFDDLERCSIETDQLLGYINNFLEHQGNKVLIIANEEEVLKKPNLSTQGYSKIKEKVIGATYKIKPNFDCAFDRFVKDLSVDVRDYVITPNKSLFGDLFFLSKSGNLRNLRQSILGFERLYFLLHESHKSKQDFLKDLLICFVIYTFEFRSGILSRENFKDLFGIGYLIKRDNGAVTIRDELAAKYKSIDLSNTVLGSETWISIILEGVIDQKAMIEEINHSKYFITKNSPAWNRLWNVYSLEEDEIISNVQELISDLKNGNFDHFNEIRHAVGELLLLAYKNLYNLKVSDVISLGKSAIQLIKDAGKLPETEAELYNIDKDASFGLGFHSRDCSEFLDFSDYVRKEIEVNIQSNYPSFVASLITSLEGDGVEFEKVLTGMNPDSKDLSQMPIFSSAEANRFANVFSQVSIANKKKVLSVFRNRYQSIHVNPKLKSEENFLRDLLLNLDSHIQSNVGKFTVEHFKSFKDIIEKSLINLANS